MMNSRTPQARMGRTRSREVGRRSTDAVKRGQIASKAPVRRREPMKRGSMKDIMLFWPSPAESGIGGEDEGQLVRDEQVRSEECWAWQIIYLTLLFIHMPWFLVAY